MGNFFVFLPISQYIWNKKYVDIISGEDLQRHSSIESILEIGLNLAEWNAFDLDFGKVMLGLTFWKVLIINNLIFVTKMKTRLENLLLFVNFSFFERFVLAY